MPIGFFVCIRVYSRSPTEKPIGLFVIVLANMDYLLFLWRQDSPVANFFILRKEYVLWHVDVERMPRAIGAFSDRQPTKQRL